ncbi:MAG TPA: transglutaminase domain-containing protein [Verrucomicrobiales bacterium]|nr:transglutaminase domain-containing protein [Verrucomicrobiales bacterium]
MRAAILIYSLFLVIEAGLAWAISGNPFLAAAVTCGMLFYAAVWKLGGPWGEIVRALTAGLITVAGPLYYKAALMPTVLCFIALPHILAATQCFWEMALSKDPAQQNVRMRTIVFTVAFYAAMGLVFVLLRGDPSVPGWITTSLAVVVLLAALPGWDLARVTRLKPGHPPKGAPAGVVARRIILGSAVLGALAAVFMGALPAVAETLCAISPRWKANLDTPDKPPPRPPQEPPPKNAEANRPGMDSSAMTGQHKLPQRSDIQSTGSEQLYVRIKDKATAERMVAAGPVYVRSHTFDAWKDGVWQSSIPGGKWFEDAADGSSDGVTVLRKTARKGVEHTVFLQNADGYSLPALQGVSAYAVPKVYNVPGDLYQMQAAGNIRYDAVSVPVIWDQLEEREKLRAGNSGNDAQTRVSAGETIRRMVSEDPLLNPDKNLPLSQHIDGMRKWLKTNVRYSTKVNGDVSLTPLNNFLLQEKKGYCDFYASAACLLLRYAGIPTRIAFGYAGNEYDPESGLLIYSDDTAHAWTEIYVQGHGWTVCDFTPPANIGHLTNKPKQKPAFDERSYEETEKKPPEPAEKKNPDEFPLAAWWNDFWKKVQAMEPMEIAKEALKWILIVAIPALLVWYLLQRKKEAAAEKDSFAEDERQPAYFAEFLRIFREAGFPRLPGSTPREYYTHLCERGATGQEFSPMISYHYRSRYTDAEPNREEEASWLTLVHDVEERLKRHRAQHEG